MFEKKFILKCLPIFGKKILLKVVPEIVTIMYPTFILWKKYIMKCVPIFEKKILLKIVLDIVTIMYPTFLFWEEIYSEMCTNILEENSSVSLTSYCYHCISYFYIWEEIYSESTAYMLILHVFVHCI